MESENNFCPTCKVELKECYRQYRDFENKIRWGWFLECINCGLIVKHLPKKKGFE